MLFRRQFGNSACFNGQCGALEAFRHGHIVLLYFVQNIKRIGLARRRDQFCAIGGTRFRPLNHEISRSGRH